MLAPLRALLGQRRRPIVALAAASALAGITESSILTAVAQAAAALADNERRIRHAVGPFHVSLTVGALLAGAFVLAVIRLALQAPVSILPARIASEVQASLRRGLFNAFTRASWTVQSRDLEGQLQELLTNQVSLASQGALSATSLVASVLTLLVLVVSAVFLNVLDALVVLAAAILLFALLRPLNMLGHRRARALSQAQMNFAGGVGEATRVAEETQVFGAGAGLRARNDELVGQARELYFRTQMLGRLIPNLYQSAIYLVLVAGLGVLYTSHTHGVASLGAVVLLLVRAGTYGQQVQGSSQTLRQAMPYIDRVQEAERRYRDNAAVAGERRLAEVRTLAFEGVSFAYTPDRPVLSDVSFEITRGEAVGIVGPSGAGKSTLVQLILRLRPPDEGSYLVNGVPASEFTLEDWIARVAYVGQEPRLLHATVAENIRYFRRLDDAAVERAARLAQIHDDIMSWPGGYEAIVGPRADAVSGGQQQRLCIARALAGNPEVLVLDEPTSALDPGSEQLLQQSLLSLKGSITLFVVAHRMSTLEICQRVMVIDGGRLAAFDTAAELRRSSGYYRRAAALAAGEGHGALDAEDL
jgi:ABC-type multidrug transport system fused ATPase/permease subunit